MQITPTNNDPYWDYLDPDKFMRDPSIPQLTPNESTVVQRGLNQFRGHRLHPEVAKDTFGAFAAAALVNYALDIAQQGAKRPALLEAAITAINKAFLVYSHPLITSRLADILNAVGRIEEAQQAHKQAVQQQECWRTKDTDILLIRLIETEDNVRSLFRTTEREEA